MAGGNRLVLQHLEIQLQGDLLLPVAEQKRMLMALLELLGNSLKDITDSSQEHSPSKPADPTPLLAWMCPPLRHP